MLLRLGVLVDILVISFGFLLSILPSCVVPWFGTCLLNP